MKRLAILIAIVSLAARPAQAYLDPGTGSVLVQGLLAVIAAAAATVAAFWSRIRRFLSGRRASGARDDQDDHDSSAS